MEIQIGRRAQWWNKQLCDLCVVAKILHSLLSFLVFISWSIVKIGKCSNAETWLLTGTEEWGLTLTVRTVTLECMVGCQKISGVVISKDARSWPVNTVLSSARAGLRLPVLLQVSLACTTCACTHAMTSREDSPMRIGSHPPHSIPGIWSMCYFYIQLMGDITYRSLKRLRGLGLSVQPHPQGQSWGTWVGPAVISKVQVTPIEQIRWLKRPSVQRWDRWPFPGFHWKCRHL